MKTNERIGSYQVLRLLGEGAMGEVYEAEEVALNRKVALKKLRAELASNQDVLNRFMHEARLLARLVHGNIASVYTLLDSEASAAIVMEYVDGGSLEEVIKHRKKLTVNEACHYILQVLDGIAYAHSAGIIHRDIKPSNAMLTRDGIIKLVDFGIARAVGSARMTRAGHMVGTLEYMAPELLRGDEGDPRTDIYAIAIMFYELLSGMPPFRATTEYDLIRAQVEEQPVGLRAQGLNVNEALDKLILRGLAKNPDQRFQSAEEFSAAIYSAVPTLTRRPMSTLKPRAPLLDVAIAGITKLQQQGLRVYQSVDKFRIGVIALALIVMLEFAYLYRQSIPGQEVEHAADAPVGSDLQRDLAESPSEAQSTEKAKRTTRRHGFSSRPAVNLPDIRGGGGLSESDIKAISEREISAPEKPSVPEVENRKTVKKNTKPEQPQKPKSAPKKPKNPPLRDVANIDKIDVHRVVRTGVLNRAGGYNMRVTLKKSLVVNEYYEVYRGRKRIIRRLVVSKFRSAGVFKSKQRIRELKELDKGEYSARVRIESGSTLLAEHRFGLSIR